MTHTSIKKTNDEFDHV